MSNMSYCRFQNTDRDLADCEEILTNLFENNGEAALSDEELKAAKRLVFRCANIIEQILSVQSVEAAAFFEQNDTDMRAYIGHVLDECNADAKDE